MRSPPPPLIVIPEAFPAGWELQTCVTVPANPEQAAQGAEAAMLRHKGNFYPESPLAVRLSNPYPRHQSNTHNCRTGLPNHQRLPGTKTGWYTARLGPPPAMPAGRRPHLPKHGGPGCQHFPRAPPAEQPDVRHLDVAASSPRTCVPRRASRHPHRGRMACGSLDVEAAALQRRGTPPSRACPKSGRMASGPREAAPRSRDRRSHQRGR